MNNKKYHDNIKRTLVHKYELYRNLLNYIKHNSNTSIQDKFYVSLQLYKLPKNSNKNRIVNRCIYTGRSHSVYRKFKMSRITLRQHAMDANITGITKSTW